MVNNGWALVCIMLDKAGDDNQQLKLVDHQPSKLAVDSVNPSQQGTDM